MSWPSSSRSYPQPIPVDPPLDIPNDLPVPSTSRVLQPRSRAASLARSAAGSRPGSRASSGSGDARAVARELNEMSGPSSQEASDWYDNSPSMQPFFNSSTLFSPPPEYNMSSAEGPSRMDYQNYHRSFEPEPMDWNAFDDDHDAHDGFSMNNESNSNRRRKRKRSEDEDDDPNLTPFTEEGPSQEVRDNTSSFPFQQGFQQGESSASGSGSGSSKKGIQRKKYNFKFSSKQPGEQYINPMQTILTEDERNQNMMIASTSSSVRSPQEYLAMDRKGKGKARAQQTPDPDSVIDISDSPPVKPADKTKKKPPNDPLSAYTCPICFSPPTNATLTPCGHICCGACLFAALKSTMQRAAMTVHGGVVDARCPVCRAVIPGWDGKGGGVIGLKPRAIFRL